MPPDLKGGLFNVMASLLKRMILISVMAVSVTGCGAAQASHTTPQASASHSSTHTKKKPHKQKALHVKGSVSSVSSSKLIVKTKAGTVWTLALTSHTKYREKKNTISSTQIKPGETVVVVARHRKSSIVARVVRLAPTAPSSP